jgi:hypothetical protein
MEGWEINTLFCAVTLFFKLMIVVPKISNVKMMNFTVILSLIEVQERVKLLKMSSKSI